MCMIYMPTYFFCFYMVPKQKVIVGLFLFDHVVEYFLFTLCADQSIDQSFSNLDNF